MNEQTDNHELLDELVVEQLKSLDFPFEVVPIDSEYADTAAFCEKYGFPEDQSANTIIVASKRGEKKFVACVVLATTRLDVNHCVRGLMGVSRVSFANAEQMQDLTGMKVGGVTALGLPGSLPIYVDSRIMQLDWIILGSGGREAKIKISPDVFNKLPNAESIEGLAN
jgi:prolyl-tRNA editing enzyme YbaK/EbsC (Cys-tRNA(Pro) deacylase)